METSRNIKPYKLNFIERKQLIRNISNGYQNQKWKDAKRTLSLQGENVHIYICQINF